MTISDQDIRDLTVNIWETVLSLPIVPVDAPAAPEPGSRSLSGCVTLTGAWRGAVGLHCSAGFARQAAAVIFGIDAESAGANEIQDALGELTNIVGGNVKSLLPRPTQISLPAVAEGSDYTLRIPHCKLVSLVAFECLGEPVAISVLLREAVEDEEPVGSGMPHSVRVL